MTDKFNEIYDELFEQIVMMEIIDTHEHLPSTERERYMNGDVLNEYMPQYFGRDLVSAGLSKENYMKAADPHFDLMERFEILEPYWEICRHTGYGQSLDCAARLLYGINEININTVELLNERFLIGLHSGNQYHRVLKEVSRIKVSILDNNQDYDRVYFQRAFRFDSIIYLRKQTTLSYLEQETGINIISFDSYLEAVGALLEKIIAAGTHILKSALAYVRPIKYERTPKHDAECDFNQFFKGKHFPDWEDEGIIAGVNLQNYMMHYVLQLASKHALTYQFHTGFQEGNGNRLENSDPMLLTNLFIEYPNVSFDLFHIGFPYQQKVGILAKMFPNVTADMCWAHIISPAASVRTLYEWLDLMPYNKISGFGGDYGFVDGVAGHQYLARQNVARALSMKVQEGVFSSDKAIRIAQNIFFDNPKRIFQLEF